MIYFIEMWNPKEKWLLLTKEERLNYLKGIQNAIVNMEKHGVEVLTWSINDEKTDRRANFNYFAIWKFPDMELSQVFQEAVENAGWYEYFEQSNIQGSTNSVEKVIDVLANTNRVVQAI